MATWWWRIPSVKPPLVAIHGETGGDILEIGLSCNFYGGAAERGGVNIGLEVS